MGVTLFVNGDYVLILSATSCCVTYCDFSPQTSETSLQVIKKNARSKWTGRFKIIFISFIPPHHPLNITQPTEQADRYAASAHSPRSLIRNIEMTAAKQFRYGAETDASSASSDRDSQRRQGLTASPCDYLVLDESHGQHVWLRRVAWAVKFDFQRYICWQQIE